MSAGTCSGWVKRGDSSPDFHTIQLRHLVLIYHIRLSGQLLLFSHPAWASLTSPGLIKSTPSSWSAEHLCTMIRGSCEERADFLSGSISMWPQWPNWAPPPWHQRASPTQRISPSRMSAPIGSEAAIFSTSYSPRFPNKRGTCDTTLSLIISTHQDI